MAYRSRIQGTHDDPRGTARTRSFHASTVRTRRILDITLLILFPETTTSILTPLCRKGSLMSLSTFCTTSSPRGGLHTGFWIRQVCIGLALVQMKWYSLVRRSAAAKLNALSKWNLRNPYNEMAFNGKKIAWSVQTLWNHVCSSKFAINYHFRIVRASNTSPVDSFLLKAVWLACFSIRFMILALRACLN
jgi:hypothetical protein